MRLSIRDEDQERPPLDGSGGGRARCRATGMLVGLLVLLALGSATKPAETGARARLAKGVDAQSVPRGPVLGKSVKVSVVRGRVLVQLRPGLGFFRLRHALTIPVGSKVNTKRGVVRVTSALDRRGHLQSGQFAGGLFEVRQGRKAGGLTELLLRGGDFSRCGLGARGASAAGAGKRTIRSLNARTRGGRFRTRGRYSASTVRGTVWTVIDRCDGTLTLVRRGIVVVRDLRRQVTVVLQAGDRYLTSPARTPAPAQHTLSAIRSGPGTGTVTSSPPEIDCGATCSAHFADGTVVTLTATASAGSTFSSWSGCDSVSGNQCTVSMTADRTVTATFVPVQRTLSVNKSGSGTGTVTSSPAGISCGATCSAQFANGTSVTLTATPTAGFFNGWTGCDSVNGNQCTVSMTANRTVTASFVSID